MADLTTDSPVSRRIVLAFLDFLRSVKPAPGVDLEGLEVVRECLTQVFKVDPSSTDDCVSAKLLMDIFRALEAQEQQEVRSDNSHVTTDSLDAPSTSSGNNGLDLTSEPHSTGVFKDELFGQFVAALEKIQFFSITPDGREDQTQLDKATLIFHKALDEMVTSGCSRFDQNTLAEALKSLGNRAMQSKLYADAIELYSCAVALCDNNAIYYCNRAAAYTQVCRYDEAIRDCQRSFEIDPCYSKAYSRLGFAYYAQGNYVDAINKGFLKALQLDPNNDAVKENIRMAETKLREEVQRSLHNQSSGTSSQSTEDRSRQTSSANQSDEERSRWSAGGSRSNSNSSPFPSMSFNIGSLPADLAGMFTNMAANAYQGHSQDRPQGDGGSGDNYDDQNIRIDGNVSLNFGEQMPEDLTGALRSVMGIFSGASQGNPQNNASGRSGPT